MSTTIHDIARDVYVVDLSRTQRNIYAPGAPRVTDGMKVRRGPSEEGLQTFSPEQLLSLHVQTVSVNGKVSGYQRGEDIPHARRIARAMLDGKPFPPPIIAVEGNGRLSIVDGQHRVLGAVIARLPLECIVKRLDKATQAELFFGQRNAKTVDPNVLVLAGSSAYARYVQEAVAGNADHPWDTIVSANKSSKTRIAPYAMFKLLIRYVANAEIGAARITPYVEEQWDRGLADELAPLIAAFGNKKTNPLAFRPFAVQAVGATAMHVFRRHEVHRDDFDRWHNHMPTFPFDQWLHVRTQRVLVTHLVDHWNKRLSGERRVTV